MGGRCDGVGESRDDDSEFGCGEIRSAEARLAPSSPPSDTQPVLNL